tara:strand:- start:517 stop:762 length:246 start_codon:yes stop_codon:yes gene_type:complete
MTHDKLRSNRIRVTSATIRPNLRTLSLDFSGTLFANSVIKITLSIPNIISRKERVRKATHTDGSNNKSNNYEINLKNLIIK